MFHEKNQGELTACVTAVALSAFAIESLSNTVGSRLYPTWEAEHAFKSPPAKVRLLGARLGLNLDEDKQPLSEIVALFKLRNQLAHSRPEDVAESKHLTEEEYNNPAYFWPRSTLEGKLSLAQAERAVGLVKDLKHLYSDAMPPDLAYGINVEMSMGSARPTDEMLAARAAAARQNS